MSLQDDTIFEKGAIIQGQYRVEDEPIQGGFGRVYKVYYAAWNVYVALKQPRRDKFQSAGDKELFTNECNHWINLGLHPHIVSCYHVHKIDDLPIIVSEWMDGGSLRKWIESEELYAGSDEVVKERLLDIAIQFARGLHYAHEQGMIHQDVKPDNLLLTADGVAKVSDFGIASVIARLSETDTAISGGDTIVVKANAYTPAYCSPEQARKENLTRRTDIWSWAVSVLEMFMGERLWLDGIVAGLACEDYFGMERIPIPEAMKDLLRRCFRENEADRPFDFGIVEAQLLEIYCAETGHDYSRTIPSITLLSAANLNNHALSFLGLNKPEEAVKCWEKALSIVPAHLESLINRSIYHWVNARIDDREVIRTSNSIGVNAALFLTEFYLAIGDAENAAQSLKQYELQFGRNAKIASFESKIKTMIAEGRDGKCVCTFSGSTIFPSLPAHNEWVSSVSFSPDGLTALSSSEDCTVKLWNTTTGECIQQLSGLFFNVYTATFSPDGQKTVAGGKDKWILLWDLTTGQSIRNFRLDTPVWVVCFRNDGREILSACQDGTIRLWDTETGDCQRFQYTKDKIRRACYGPALQGFKGHSFFFDAGKDLGWGIDGKLIEVYRGHKEDIFGICKHPSKDILFTASVDGTIKSWDYLKSTSCIRTYNLHQARPLSLSITPDGKKLITGNEDHTIKIWSVETGKCIRTLEGHTWPVTAIGVSPNGKRIISGSSNGTIKIWTIPEEGRVTRLLCRMNTTELSANNARKFNDIAININRLIADGNISEALSAFNELNELRPFGDVNVFFEIIRKLTHCCFPQKGIFLREMFERKIELDALCFISQDGRTALSGRYWHNNRMVNRDDIENERNPENYILMQLWDVPTEKCICTFRGRKEQKLSSLCLNADATKAVSGGMDNLIKLWDTTSGACVSTLHGHDEPVSKVSFNNDGSLVLSGSHDRTIKLWNSYTGQCVHTFTGHTGEVLSAVFSPDETQILSASFDRSLKLWDVKTGKCIHTYSGHTDRVFSALFSRNGGNAVSTGADNKIILWKLHSGAIIRTLQETRPATVIHISVDGTKLISGGVSGKDRTVRLWDLVSGECIHTFEGLSAYFCPAYFGEDNKIFIASMNSMFVYQMVFNLHFPGWKDWSDGARPYLEIFLTFHPNWTDEDFTNILIPELQRRGFGWLRPEGVRVKLEEMSLIK